MPTTLMNGHHTPAASIESGRLPVGLRIDPAVLTRPSAPCNNSQPQPEPLDVLIRNNLDSTGYQQLRRLDVLVENGHVRLSGRVGRYYLVQVAQRAAMKTAGVVALQSDIQVVRD